MSQWVCVQSVTAHIPGTARGNWKLENWKLENSKLENWKLDGWKLEARHSKAGNCKAEPFNLAWRSTGNVCSQGWNAGNWKTEN
jgi:hypothetical protein